MLLLFFVLLFLVSFVFPAVFGITTSSTVTPTSPHVPLPRTKSDEYSRVVVIAFFGVIFGGVNCIGWNFTYAIPAFELHRALALAITHIPLVAPIDYVLENFKLDRGAVRLTLDLIVTILLFVYVTVRLLPIAQHLYR